jgi:hypothetical protein
LHQKTTTVAFLPATSFSVRVLPVSGSISEKSGARAPSAIMLE